MNKTIQLNAGVVNAEELTDAELEEAYAEISLKNIFLANQITEAKISAAAGDYSDPDWFVRLKAAKRFTGADLQWIAAERGRRKRRHGIGVRGVLSDVTVVKAAAREERKTQLSNVFVDVVRESVDDELFQIFLSEAKRRVSLSCNSGGCNGLKY